jgi:integrase
MTTLRQAVQEYVRMRRDLGFKLREAGKGLLDFAGFMERQRASYITQALALQWAQQPSYAQPAHWAQRLGFVRGFAQYRSATDPRTQIPAPGLLPFQPKRARPYLYTDAEIQGLLTAALKMPYRFERGKLRPWVYYCLFGLLSVSGLRLGEACNLELQDVDLKAAILTIRPSAAPSSARLDSCRCIGRPARSSPSTSNGAAATGHSERFLLTCSCLAAGIAWIGATFIVRSMRYPARSVCAAPPTVMARACTT